MATATDSINTEGFEDYVIDFYGVAQASRINADGTIDYCNDQPTRADLDGLDTLEREAMADEFRRLAHDDRAL